MESDVRHWTLSDVSLWLQSMDMACYAEAFESNRIDGEALVLMDEAALRILASHRSDTVCRSWMLYTR